MRDQGMLVGVAFEGGPLPAIDDAGGFVEEIGPDAAWVDFVVGQDVTLDQPAQAGHRTSGKGLQALNRIELAQEGEHGLVIAWSKPLHRPLFPSESIRHLAY